MNLTDLTLRSSAVVCSHHFINMKSIKPQAREILQLVKVSAIKSDDLVQSPGRKGRADTLKHGDTCTTRYIK